MSTLPQQINPKFRKAATYDPFTGRLISEGGEYTPEEQQAMGVQFSQIKFNQKPVLPLRPPGDLGDFGGGARHGGGGYSRGGGGGNEGQSWNGRLNEYGRPTIKAAPSDYIDTPTSGGDMGSLDNFYKLQDKPSLGRPVNESIFDRVKGYEHGGYPQPGLPALVGEGGPELIVPLGQTRVIPNDELGPFGLDTNVMRELPPFQPGNFAAPEVNPRAGTPTMASNALDPYRRTLGRPTVGREEDVDKLLKENPGYKLHLQRTLRTPQGMAFMDDLELAHEAAQNKAELEAFQQNRLDARERMNIGAVDARAAAAAKALADDRAVEHNFKLADESRKAAEFARSFVQPDVNVVPVPNTDYVIPFAGNRAMGTLPTNAPPTMDTMETFPGSGEYVRTRRGEPLPQFGTATMTDQGAPEIDFPGMKLPFGELPAVNIPERPAKFAQKAKGGAKVKERDYLGEIKKLTELTTTITDPAVITRLQARITALLDEYENGGKPAAGGSGASDGPRGDTRTTLGAASDGPRGDTRTTAGAARAVSAIQAMMKRAQPQR